MHGSLKVECKVDSVIEKAFGVFALISKGIEYKCWDIIIRLCKSFMRSMAIVLECMDVHVNLHMVILNMHPLLPLLPTSKPRIWFIKSCFSIQIINAMLVFLSMLISFNCHTL